MNHAVASFLFAAAVVGIATTIAGGFIFGLFVTARRGVLASRERWRLATEHDSAFHHPDKIRTPLGEWLFMAVAGTVVLLGLPVALATIFEFIIPMLGRAWSH